MKFSESLGRTLSIKWLWAISAPNASKNLFTVRHTYLKIKCKTQRRYELVISDQDQHEKNYHNNLMLKAMTMKELPVMVRRSLSLPSIVMAGWKTSEWNLLEDWQNLPIWMKVLKPNSSLQWMPVKFLQVILRAPMMRLGTWKMMMMFHSNKLQA